MHENQIAWLAGILEGEGSFFLNRNTVKGKVYLYPHIVVNMTDRDIIERVAELFGNSVYSIPPTKREIDKKPAFRASIQGAKAAAIMRQLLPWMGSRRSAKIKEVLDYYDSLEPVEVRRSRSCSVAQQKRRRNEQGQYIS